MQLFLGWLRGGDFETDDDDDDEYEDLPEGGGSGGGGNRGGKGNGGGSFLMPMLLLLSVVFLLFNFIRPLGGRQGNAQTKEVSYSDFLRMVELVNIDQRESIQA